MKRVITVAALSILAWIGLFFGLYHVAVGIAVSERLTRLNKDGHRTVGRVIGKEASDHARVDYEFLVDSVRYTGSGRAGAVNANLEDLTPGTSVHVTFDPSEPANSMLGSPADEINSIKLLVKAAAFVIPIFPITILFGLSIALTRKSRIIRP